MPTDLLPAISKDKYWEPDNWSPRHRLIVSLHLLGSKNVEIAEQLGVSQQRVSVIINDPRAQYEIERLSSEIADHTLDTHSRLQLYANEALDEIVEEMRTARDVRVRQKAAFGILDRAGYTAEKMDRGDGEVLLPADVVDRMEETTREITAHEIEYEEVDPEELKIQTGENGGDLDED